MDEVYDLLQHTHYIIFHLGVNTTNLDYYSTSTRNIKYKAQCMTEASYITYDKHKANVLSWGHQSVRNNKQDTVKIDVSREKLYRLFKKGKDSWDQDDLFTLTAVSDFIRLSIEELIKDSKGEIKDSGALHYVLLVPSEWEEEIREVLIRPIFVQANLILKEDHQDRLLFCSDVESIYYYLSSPKSSYFTEMRRNTILGRIVAVEKNQVSIKLYLISLGNPLFDFSGSVTRPKIMNSNAMSLTSDDVKNGIREFIKIKFSFDAQEDTILNIMKELGNNTFTNMEDEEEASYLTKPFIKEENISELDKHQEELIRSIRPFDICAETSKHLSNNLKQLLPNNLVKEYYILKFTDKYTSDIQLDEGLLQWSRFMFEYNRISFASNYIVPKSLSDKSIYSNDILHGDFRYSVNAIRNSNIYSKPRILPTEHSVTSSSTFLNSKPDAILDIDILLDSTVLSFSLLDENGLVKEIWNHDYFAPDIGLRSLGSFFDFSKVTTLNVKKSYNDIDATARGNDNIKTGYAITVEKMLLQKLLVTEDDLRDMIYAMVTESGSDHEDQETIVVQEEIIHIPNIYDSLCFNMWNNITEDSSLIQLCNTHKGYNGNELLDIFSLENKAEFMNNLKKYISKEILNKNLTTQKADRTTVYLSNSCNYDETDYFLYEQRIDVDHYTIPKLPNQLLQPILQQEPCSYKGFQVGVLRQVYSENFGFGFENSSDDTPVVLKNNREDRNTILIDDENLFPLFKKGDKMNESQLNRVFYLNMNQEEDSTILRLCRFL
ncbi:hypothetical protein INT48_001711 [Thamnidium elegans]|uniref:Uncharacterized protein n=1 Tax=Thamnidium elegans TaxID=101142 RepID=A0A8H7SS08_9FUNG|nr:hypothetical protein INT48_001711 [Thamnidium elegans]